MIVIIIIIIVSDFITLARPFVHERRRLAYLTHLRPATVVYNDGR